MEEKQYFDLINQVLESGDTRHTRNAITISLFSPNQLRFNLQQAYPLLTSKFISFKNIFNELLWFLKGQTDGQILKDQKTFIWTGNGTREYLDSVGLQHYDKDDLGPIYGFQWRHHGAEYINCKTDYTSKGYDQLYNLINQIIFTPNSRRMILSAWNPSDFSKMALPPCHILSQFYVVNGKLSCHLYQRSADIGLGVPYNIASYALLTSIIAHFTNLTPGNFIYTIGDAHIYSTHQKNLIKQTKSKTHDFPTITINKPNIKQNLKNIPNITSKILNSITSLSLNDVTLTNYIHEEKISLMFY